jgi:hypothetical protein
MPLLVPAAAVMLERSSSWARGWFLFLSLASTMLLLQIVILLPDVGRGFILPVPALRGFPAWQGLFQPHSTFMDVTVHPFATRWTTAYVVAGMVASLWLILRPALSRRWAVGTMGLVLALGIISHNVQAEYDPSGSRPRDVAQKLLNLDLSRVVVVRSAPTSLRFSKLQVAGDESGMPTNVPARPPDNWRYLDSSSVVMGVDGEGNSCREALTDAVMDTRWSVFTGTTNFPALTFTFDRPVSLCGIRFLSPDDRYPREVVVEGQEQDGEPWATVLPAARSEGRFWSGRQVAREENQYYQEWRFAVPTGGLRSVRMAFRMAGNPHEVRLSEVLFMEQATPPEGTIPSFDACLAVLRTAGVRQFYGPQWISDRLAWAVTDKATMQVPSRVPDTAEAWAAYDPVRPRPVLLRGRTGFMMDVRDAPRSRALLRARGLNWEETALGCYVLLLVPRPEGTDDAARYPILYWTELGCFAADRGRFASRKAQVFYEKAIQFRKSGNQAGMLEMLGKALEAYPAHEPARRTLIEVLKTCGRNEEAATQEAIFKTLTVPQVPARIRFAGGIEFLGLALSAQKVKPGGSVDVGYFWKCPPSSEAARPAVFVHFVQGKKLFFQDDHKLLEELFPEDLRNQPFNEILTERRAVLVPASVLPGTYEITVGLYNPKNERRLKVETALPEKRREIHLPAVLQVGS